jgi:lipopolysaccharide biosynthesis regulator YciM
VEFVYFEYWWLLAFPLFFGMGWLAARIDIKQIVSESRALPGSYFKGLNFLLNEQPDKAIEAFIEVVKVDPQTIELHFALGSLFRRRGEVERAIRMHQNLAERPDLEPAERRQAVYELAQDYLKAGLLDRAEEHFSQLLGTDLDEQALGFLLEIYEQEKDWEQAISTAGRLEAHTGQSRQKQIAHFECEIASREIMQSRFDAARPHLANALGHHRLCVRANILLGDLEQALGNDEAAIETWQRIESQNPEYLPLVAERLIGAYRRLGRVDEGRNLLKF